MNRRKLTPAQTRTLRGILDGTIGTIISVDARVRRELERRGLLPWAGLNASNDEIRRLVYSGPARYGRIDRARLVSILKAAGCGECDDCQEILVEPTQVERGLFCPYADAKTTGTP